MPWHARQTDDLSLMGKFWQMWAHEWRTIFNTLFQIADIALIARTIHIFSGHLSPLWRTWVWKCWQWGIKSGQIDFYMCSKAQNTHFLEMSKRPFIETTQWAFTEIRQCPITEIAQWFFIDTKQRPFTETTLAPFIETTWWPFIDTRQGPFTETN